MIRVCMIRGPEDKYSAVYVRRGYVPIGYAGRVLLFVSMTLMLSAAHHTSMQPSGVSQEAAGRIVPASSATGRLQDLSIAARSAADGSGRARAVSGSRIRPNANFIQAQVQHPAFPLKASGLGPYLVDQNGTPFLIKGDSPWGIPYNGTITNTISYLAQRRAQGFNLVYMTVMDNQTYGSATYSYANINDVPAFTGTVGGQPDLTTPNPAYWSGVDADVQAATNDGFAIILIPLDAGNGSLGSCQ